MTDAAGLPMPLVRLPSGQAVPALGMGTWNMAENPKLRTAEISALRLGIELGMRLIDTAEMYGDGASERLVAEAIAPQRDLVFVVSKVYPHNAGYQGVLQACDRSLKRLRSDWLDLYLLHWRGSVPLSETVHAFEHLRQRGKIKSWGVSNFDVGDMQELLAAPDGGACATNQVLYNLSRRGPEFDLLPFLSQQRMPLMAYSPVEQGRLSQPRALAEIAQRHNANSFQVGLAWLLRRPDVIAIPKSGNVDHLRQNHAALALKLSPQDLETLDRAFPPPVRKKPLEIL
jgi:diketogulonate reductase-like aldo/keto reductase